MYIHTYLANQKEVLPRGGASQNAALDRRVQAPLDPVGDFSDRRQHWFCPPDIPGRILQQGDEGGGRECAPAALLREGAQQHEDRAHFAEPAADPAASFIGGGEQGSDDVLQHGAAEEADCG
jgi:hypothetical protein